MPEKTASKRSELKLRPGDCVCLGLRRAARTVTRLYDDALRPSKLKATQFSLLALLFNGGRTPFSELTARLATDQTTLTRNLRPLERRGLIRVTPGDDRRTRDIQLTSAGKNLYKRADVQWRSAQKQAIGVIGNEDWKAIQVQLDRLLGDLRV
jgi:DNA-binding MarR family transcriptional regulator